MREIAIRTSARVQLVNISSEVSAALEDVRGDAAACQVFVPHTTAAIVINESADPDVARDLAAAYQALVPEIRFDHAEGNSDAHLLATLLGSSVMVRLDRGRMCLGTWQGIFLVELDGPRHRRVWVHTL
jgi:secondary thiamine-phosphate synthase enzyme